MNIIFKKITKLMVMGLCFTSFMSLAEFYSCNLQENLNKTDSTRKEINARVDTHNGKITSINYLGMMGSNKIGEDYACEFNVPNLSITSIWSTHLNITSIDVLDPTQKAKIDIEDNQDSYKINFSKMNTGYYCGFGATFPVALTLNKTNKKCVVQWDNP